MARRIIFTMRATPPLGGQERGGRPHGEDDPARHRARLPAVRLPAGGRGIQAGVDGRGIGDARAGGVPARMARSLAAWPRLGGPVTCPAASGSVSRMSKPMLLIVSIDTEEDNWHPCRDGVTVENIRELPRLDALFQR